MHFTQNSHSHALQHFSHAFRHSYLHMQLAPDRQLHSKNRLVVLIAEWAAGFNPGCSVYLVLHQFRYCNGIYTNFATCIARSFFFAAVVNLVAMLFHGLRLVTEACSDAENRDSWDLPQPASHASCSPHPPHRTCQLVIHFGWIPGSSALSTRTWPLSCWVTGQLSWLEHGRPFAMLWV